MILRVDDLAFSATEVFASTMDVLFEPVDYPAFAVTGASVPKMDE